MSVPSVPPGLPGSYTAASTRRPGALTAICVIAIVLGSLGLLGSLMGIVGIIGGIAFAMIFALAKLSYYAVGWSYLRRPAAHQWFEHAEAEYGAEGLSG